MSIIPFISIIIPAKNEEKLIRGCLTSISQLDYPKERIEIIIVDGLSTDNTAQVATDMGAMVLSNPKQTVSPGRNLGFEHAKGELIAFTDADCVVDKTWLSNCIKYFEQDKSVACVGGPNLTPADESDFGKAVGFVFDQPVFAAGSIHARELDNITEVSSIPGCNAIYRQSTLSKVMPLDETMLTGDDTLLNRKILDLGCKLLYTPDVKVYHYRRPTPAKLWRQFYRYAIGRLQIGKKDIRLLNMTHVVIGLSVPLFILTVTLLVWSKSFLVLISLLSLSFFFILYFVISGMLKWRSIHVGLQVPIVIALIMTSWSFGFLRELIFPTKPVVTISTVKEE